MSDLAAKVLALVRAGHATRPAIQGEIWRHIPGSTVLGHLVERGALDHGNPVALGKPCPRCGANHGRDAKGIECTAGVLIERLDEPGYRAQVAALDGMVLECSCAPTWCHAELLVADAEAYAERLAICEVENVPDAAAVAHRSGVCAVWQSAKNAIEKATRGQQSLKTAIMEPSNKTCH